MLTSKTLETLTFAVKQSIHRFMEENMFQNCLGKDGEIIESTQQEIVGFFYDCEAYLNMAEIEIEYDLDGDDVFTGRYMLWNPISKALLNPLKHELLEWANEIVPIEHRNFDESIDDSDFFALCWLAYLKSNYKNVSQYYLNEKESIRKLYF